MPNRHLHPGASVFLLLVLATLVAFGIVLAGDSGSTELHVLIPSGDAAPAGQFYQFEDTFGTLNFTDDPAAVPRRYRATVKARRFEDLQPVMPIQNAQAPYVRYQGARYDRRAPGYGSRVAGPPVTIDRVRVDADGFNRPYYVAREGERVISVTRQLPRVVINR